jgi:SpoVK/Ycf46/Vps4 family AAA+-type ATPase
MLPNKFIFYGPKGCGKSKFARATFGEFSKVMPGWMTIEVQKARILGSPLDNIKEIFSTISQYQINGIIIEDFDALLADLGLFTAAKRTLIEGIKEIGENQFLIATTRHPRKIDEAILSDFDSMVPFYYPSERDRRDILRVHTEVIRKVALADDVNLDDIANRTAWFSGADLENIVLYAANISKGHPIWKKELAEALNFIGSSISITKRVEEMQELVDFAIRYCTINPVKEELLAYAAALNIPKAEPEFRASSMDLNKILELKPNFCGLGLNINEIIETIRRKLKDRRNKG